MTFRTGSWKSLPQNRIYLKKKKERKKRNEGSLKDPEDNITCTTICIYRSPEGEEREKEPGEKF